MSNPFDFLPAPKQQAPAAAPKQVEAARTDAEEDAERTEKRQRVAAEAEAEAAAVGSGAAAEAAAHAHDAAADAQEPAPMPADQVAPALLRIANHISNPAKFAKAAGLLRQLIAGGALTGVHRSELFGALRAAFADPTRADDPLLRREYRRLLNAFTNGVPPDVFSAAQGAHFEVYSIWVMQRGEFATDDSFVFNKAVSRLKEDIAALGPVTEEEEAAASGLELPWGSRKPGGAAGGGGGKTSILRTAAAAPVAADDEADPFGLNEVMRANAGDQQQPPAAAQHAQPQGGDDDDADADGAAWTEAELSVMRRQALLDCVTAVKGMHKLQCGWGGVGGVGMLQLPPEQLT